MSEQEELSTVCQADALCHQNALGLLMPHLLAAILDPKGPLWPVTHPQRRDKDPRLGPQIGDSHHAVG